MPRIEKHETRPDREADRRICGSRFVWRTVTLYRLRSAGILEMTESLPDLLYRRGRSSEFQGFR